MYLLVCESYSPILCRYSLASRSSSVFHFTTNLDVWLCARGSVCHSTNTVLFVGYTDIDNTLHTCITALEINLQLRPLQGKLHRALCKHLITRTIEGSYSVVVFPGNHPYK